MKDTIVSNEETPLICSCCGAPVEIKYTSNGYDITWCAACKTNGAYPLPSEEELKEYYQGFSFCTHEENLKYIQTDEVKVWLKGLVGDSGSKTMLDIGGGGGFFSKVFQDFGFGEATYIDLDGEACAFASTTMGLQTVINDSVEHYLAQGDGKKYDFIYCRHVIEHLRDPASIVSASVDLLSEGGTLIFQCPNGRSKEGVLYPKYWDKFLIPLRQENGWSSRRAWFKSLHVSYGWGIAPPRHIWAFGAPWFTQLLHDKTDIKVKVGTALRDDPVYSPYWSPTGRREKAGALAARFLHACGGQGMHLVITITKPIGATSTG